MHRKLSDNPGELPGDRKSPGSRPSLDVRSGLFAALVAAIVGLVAASAPIPQVAAAPDQRQDLPPIYGLLDVRNDVDQRIGEAKRLLIVACMAEQGFQYSDAGERDADDESGSGLRLFGLESLDDITDQAPQEPASQGEAYGRALFGDPEKRIVATGARVAVSRPATGCLAEAENRLLGDLRPRRMQLRMQLFDAERDTREQLDGDAEFRAANERWRACMKLTGVDAPDPLQLLAGLPQNADLRSNPAVHADLRCKAETGYLRTAYGRLAEIQQAWLDRHPKLATDWNAIRNRQAAAARQVVGS
jgi:hypothetical protein